MTKPRKFEKVDEAETREGQIKDFISGQWVKVSPEEVDAVQIFSRRLVEDFDYPKSHVQTRPQFRVRKRPSDQEKSYPVDIAVFRSSNRIEDELFLIVECKKKNRKDGLAQLKLYLDMSPADVGVWFNGQEHAYLRKIHHKDGRRTYEELPNIPRHGQRIEDIGQFQRKDLKIPSDLKAVFRDLRNHLAGNVTGITRDEALAQQIINILFCKIYDEINTGSNEVVTFRTGIDEPARDVKKRILALFDDSVKAEFDDVFDKTDAITIDADSLVYVVGELQNYCITEASRDAVGDAFEVFIGPALRGGEGQFFTPRNVVRMMIEILDPKPSDMILDPACGSGGFLIMALEYVWKKIEGQAKKKGWSNGQLDHKKREIASKCLRGIDKDSFLAKVTKAYMAIIGDGRGGVFCENSLVPTIDWHHSTQDKIKLRSFDLVFTNPPFGTKIPIKGERVLGQYDLGSKWKKDKDNEEIEKTDSLHDDQPPQILFLERCLQFLNPGGRLGIVLPEAVFGMPTYEYVVAFLRERTRILGIVSMPEALFKTSGKGGTHAKVCVVFIQNSRPKEAEDYAIFMADAKWCGHDSRGNPTIRLDAQGNELLLDDIPTIADKYKLLSSDPQGAAVDHLGFFLSNSSINKNIFIPKYYDPEIKKHLSKLAKTHQLVALGEFVDQGVLQADTGIEVGKMAYGTGPVPFIRTSDISNWELKADPKQNVSAELYEQFKEVQDVQAEDIFVVRDGTYLVGVSCILTEHDTRILYCGGIYKIRVLRKDKLDPYLLLALLNCPIVKRQMRSKQFTRDVIDTLGKRIYEVVLPIPKAGTLREQIAKETRETVIARVELRNRAQQIALEVEGITDSEDAETIDDI